MITVAVVVPALLEFGLIGYAIGWVLVTAFQVAVAGYYMRQVLGDFSALRQLVRSVTPVVPPAAAILRHPSRLRTAVAP